MSGYLKEWKGTKWKKRWYVVKDKALYRFKASEVLIVQVNLSLMKAVTGQSSDG